jgi:hypothetical protein
MFIHVCVYERVYNIYEYLGVIKGMLCIMYVNTYDYIYVFICI